MSARLLLTGGTGLIGRAVLERGSEHEFVAVARSGPPEWGRELANVEWIEADLARPDFAASLPSEISAVVHAAGSRRQRDGAEGALDLFEVNVGSTARLLDYARGAGAERFLLASTASVYRAGSEPLPEDAPIDCGSLYEASKRGAELLLAAHAEQLAGMSLRVFTPYGAGQRRQLIAELIDRVRAGEPIDVWGERGLLMSPIHVDDVARAFLGAIRLPVAELPGVVNVGGPDRLGIEQVGELIGAALRVEVCFERHGGDEPLGYLADRSKAAALLDAPEPVGFAEGLRRTLAAKLP